MLLRHKVHETEAQYTHTTISECKTSLAMQPMGKASIRSPLPLPARILHKNKDNTEYIIICSSTRNPVPFS